MLRSKTKIRLALFLVLPFLVGCASVQRWIDKSSLEKTVQQILQEPLTGNPATLRAFVDTFDLEKATLPLPEAHFTIRPLDHWVLSKSTQGPITAAQIRFPSALRQGGAVDSAIFYLYRTSELREGKVILWVPGMGVSNLAFRFIRRFFQTELDQGYAVAVYVPPFHLERRVPGKENGEGFFSADPLANLDVILNMVRELRTMKDYLSQQGVKTIGGWGGSMGASALLLLASLQPFDHLCLMIPVVDWRTVACDNPSLQPVTAKLFDLGYDRALLNKAYCLLSPVNYTVQILPSRIQILYAREDQLTPEAVTLDYAQKIGVARIKGFARSHATILLTPSLYKDYEWFLKNLEK